MKPIYKGYIMMRNKRKWDESQSGQWKYFLMKEKESKKRQELS